jgi:glycosyltransferase involved in cell wall biosynthesis
MLLRCSDVVLFLSKTERDVFRDKIPCAPDKIGWIYNSIRLPALSSTERRSDTGELRVMFAGRLVSEKGIGVFLQAAEREYPFPVLFTVYGDGPLRLAVKASAESNPKLRAAGVFAHQDWSKVLSQHDILVLPSITSFEGMPMIILEAMSMGVIPIATPFGSIPEMLGATRGILTRPKDVAEVVAAIESLATADQRRRMSDECREFAKNRFDIQNNCRTFLEIYAQMSLRPSKPPYRLDNIADTSGR